MSMKMNGYAAEVYNKLSQDYYWEKEFLASVEENFLAITPFLNEHEFTYRNHKILENLVEPDRIYTFRVPWIDDRGQIQVNTGWRVEFNNSIGPYKGGLRFHASTTLSTLKFLGFEQIFKNALTGLPIGGGKGGSNFSPRGRSDNEIRTFSRSFMQELCKHIDANTDVPAGDIGVGGREIGYLFGHYKRMKNSWEGVLTGKSVGWGGSYLRPEATGYGAIYFLQEMMAKKKDSIEGKTFAVSGFGNVSWGAVKKIAELGGKVVTISGPDGMIYDREGIKGDKIDYMLELRHSNNDIVAPYATKFKAEFMKGKKPWIIPTDVAIPCAIQNEVDDNDARELIKNKVKYVVEGANQPLTNPAVALIQEAKISYVPGKASNAGGVACSCFEMSQNASFTQWSKEKVDQELKNVMKNIHDLCYQAAIEVNMEGNYQVGANIAGFRRVADAMIDQGLA